MLNPVASSQLIAQDCQTTRLNPLSSLRQWLEAIEIHDPKVARFLCKTIPTHCPFERDLRFLGRTLFHLPPLCKLNPLYDQFVGLRLRALIFLIDECGEDSQYCC
ncbi:MAG TPA: Mo-dependent nitrogenase C-terminal domain-containing protein [Candidatus Caenarcaniphilales bacterium]